jgi:hypothetical protein
MMAHTTKLTVIRLAFGLAALVVASSAGAQAKKPKSVPEGAELKTYYWFDDDPLNAGAYGTGDYTIKVRNRHPRSTLIRPRAQFVTEMLKSVENI